MGQTVLAAAIACHIGDPVEAIPRPPRGTCVHTNEDRTGAQTREAILETAVRAFRFRGYEAATLGGIAEELGITRSAVLHHFASKEALLREAIAPFVAKLDALLDRREAAGRLTARKRRQFLTEMVDLACDHRHTAALLTHDVSLVAHLGPDLLIGDRAARFAQIVTITVDDPFGVTRALAAVGCILRPVYSPDDLIDLSLPEVRQVLVDAAMAVFSTAPKTK